MQGKRNLWLFRDDDLPATWQEVRQTSYCLCQQQPDTAEQLLEMLLSDTLLHQTIPNTTTNYTTQVYRRRPFLTQPLII